MLINSVFDTKAVKWSHALNGSLNLTVYIARWTACSWKNYEFAGISKKYYLWKSISSEIVSFSEFPGYFDDPAGVPGDPSELWKSRVTPAEYGSVDRYVSSLKNVSDDRTREQRWLTWLKIVQRVKCSFLFISLKPKHKEQIGHG